MIRYISLLAPFIFRASGGTSQRLSLANLILAYAFLFFGGVFALIALYVWVEATYGVLIACMTMSIVMLIAGAVLLLSKSKTTAKRAALPASFKDDPLAQQIPDSLKNDPRVRQILEKIAENPVAASAGAVAFGMIVSRELVGDL